MSQFYSHPPQPAKKSFFLRAKEFILLGAFFSNPKGKQKKVQFSLTCFSKQRNEERSSFFSLIRPFFPSVLFCPFRLIRPESDRSLCGESTNKLRLCGNFILYFKFSTGTKVFFAENNGERCTVKQHYLKKNIVKVFLKALGLFESSCVFHVTIPPLNYVSWVIFALQSRRKKGDKKVVFVVLLPFWAMLLGSVIWL